MKGGSGDKLDNQGQKPIPSNTPGKKLSDEEIKRIMYNKKIMQYQMHKIRLMPLQRLLQKQRNKQLYQPPSPTANHLHRNLVNSMKAAGFEHNLQEIAEKQMQMVAEVEANRKLQRRQMRQAPIFSQIKRGKLGMDNIFIIFAVFGSLMLPYIFYKKFENNRQLIISSRKYSPQVIQNISDDSPINIDSVSQQSIHYENPDRSLQFQKKMESARKITKLKQQLDL